MDVVQLSRYVRRRFQASLLGTEDVDESRDVAFQILALKEGLRKDHREHLKIFYNLVQAAHCGFFSQKATRNLYIGFPYLHRHFSENYCTFAAETPAPASGLGDQLLFGAGRFLSQHTFSAAAAHLESLSNDSIGAFLHKARQFDEAVRLNKLYIRILVELLGKNALGEEVKASLRRALAEASKGWALGRVEELNYEHLIGADLLGLTGGLGVEDPGLLPIIADSLGNKFEAVPIRGKLLMFFGLSSHVAKWGVEPSSSKVIDRLLGTFSDGYRSLDLKDSLLFVEALANVRYREQLLDQVVAENIIPRLSKIR
ncbi:ADP-heptose:LPS heptosyl transferase, putative [Babesia caballi]|uniref:ADP-heptose:LPS heptosyl transferase, putative n=1 Tax=Babesia caballi TaxID=5871 RepID=A0AAV4LQZ8_BABCB|nr:ADP-heptose:LPS heptosyl transferase, putative [Babesia caballi]